MTKKFDSFVAKILKESIKKGKLHLDDYEMFPFLSQDNLERGIYIEDMFVLPALRKKGNGSSELLNVIKQADIERRYIFLQPYAYEEKNHEQFDVATSKLRDFYKKFGFEGEDWMFRTPVIKVKENMGVVDVMGNDGAYDTSDTRTPNVLGPMQRRGSIKNRRKKRSRL